VAILGTVNVQMTKRASIRAWRSSRSLFRVFVSGVQLMLPAIRLKATSKFSSFRRQQRKRKPNGSRATEASRSAKLKWDRTKRREAGAVLSGSCSGGGIIEEKSKLNALQHNGAIDIRQSHRSLNPTEDSL
jgi:hypothetical protein